MKRYFEIRMLDEQLLEGKYKKRIKLFFIMDSLVLKAS